MYVQALIINAVIIIAVPKILTKPIGVPMIDEFVVYLRAQQAFLVASSLLLGLVLYLTNYWLANATKSEGPTSSTSSLVKE
jgi:hypothetical protein